MRNRIPQGRSGQPRNPDDSRENLCYGIHFQIEEKLRESSDRTTCADLKFTNRLFEHMGMWGRCRRIQHYYDMDGKYLSTLYPTDMPYGNGCLTPHETQVCLVGHSFLHDLDLMRMVPCGDECHAS